MSKNNIGAFGATLNEGDNVIVWPRGVNPVFGRVNDIFGEQVNVSTMNGVVTTHIGNVASANGVISKYKEPEYGKFDLTANGFKVRDAFGNPLVSGGLAFFKGYGNHIQGFSLVDVRGAEIVEIPDGTHVRIVATVLSHEYCELNGLGNHETVTISPNRLIAVNPIKGML